MIVHRSNRIEALVDALAELVAVPLPDPFAPEWIAVQGRGMGRWLAMELARRLGVWANPKFPFPRKVIESAMTALLGPTVSEATVFDPQTLRWAVAEALPPLLERRAFDPIRRYLVDDVRGAKRLQLAGRIAELFDQYAVYRPHMVLEWERGADSDWQAELWCAVVRTHGAEHAAARARALLHALSAGERPTGELPPRLSLFGISTLPPLYAEILAALAPSVELHLFVLSPSQEYWGDIRSRRAVQRGGVPAAEGHPLLASLGRVGRDFQSVLEEVADYRDDDRFVDPGMDAMLAVLQSDMLALHARAPGAEHAPLALRSDDDSIAVHACHGPMREIEVLHDQLLALFDRDATLAPPDVVVMTPAIDAYAPLIEAVFGSGGRPQIPFRIADRSARAQHDVIDAFLRALELLRGRLPAPDVLDLLALDPVRARFDIAAEELERLRHWVAESGIRWGADADHRAAQGQPPCEENTWRFGLDRLLLGYALPGEDTRLFNGVLPYDDVEGSDAALLGRFAEFCDTLSRFRDAARDPRHPREWRDTLSALLGALMKSTTATAHEHHALNTAFEELARQADAGGFNGSVDLDAMRRLIETEVEVGGSPRGFLTGAVTFCEMVPMRTIPFRVVCLIGLNDGAFPRARRPLGFDRMAESPRPGDRTARDDDRYLFLEALLAARERLIITYVGQSISDNTDLPPSVVVNELLDAIDRSFDVPADDTGHAAGTRPRDRIVQRHALQAFSPRYFGAAGESAALPTRAAGGQPAAPSLFSYAWAHCAGARALLGPRRSAPPPFRVPLHAAPLETVSLDELLRFFANPTRWFLQRRLGIFVGRDAGLLDAREPIELDHLEQWRIGDALLRRALGGTDVDDAWATFRAAGALPLGALGRCAYEGIAHNVSALAHAAAEARGGVRLADEELDLSIDGVRVTGVLRDLWPGGQIAVQYARLGERSELAVWVRHLAHNAARGAASTSALVGRPQKGDTPAAVWFRPAADARIHLAELLRLYRLGQCAPLPLFRFASRAYAESLANRGASDDEAMAAARSKFAENGHGGGDLDDAHVAELYGDHDPLAPDAPSPCGISFAAAARTVFEPLLRHREMRR